VKHTLRNSVFAISMAGASALAALAEPPAAGQAGIPFPHGYRQWQHVKSMVIESGHPLYESFGGIHHLYANPLAVTGYAQGRFPDGSVIVFDLLEAAAADNAIQEGSRKVLGVMYKDQRRYAATGGWGFEAFAAGDREKPVVGATAATACFACHTGQAPHDYVFSNMR